MFLLSGIRFGSVRFDLFRFGPPRRNGTPPRQPFAGRTQRIRRRAAFVFRSAATTSARHRTFAPPPVGPPRRVRPPCRRHGLHSARCRRPFIRPLRRGIRPPHGSGPLRSSPVLSGPLRSSPVLSGPLQSSPVLSGPLQSSPVLSGPLRSSPVARSALCPSPAFRVLCFPSPLRTSAAVLRIVRPPRRSPHPPPGGPGWTPDPYSLFSAAARVQPPSSTAPASSARLSVPADPAAALRPLSVRNPPRLALPLRVPVSGFRPYSSSMPSSLILR